MKQIALLLILILSMKTINAQEEVSEKFRVPQSEVTVPFHKDQLKLTLYIDSMVIGKKSYRLNFKKVLDIQFESDYLQVKDDLYIKIFISRNQEYGKKFYSWKWNYLRKKGNEYFSLNIGYYDQLFYNQPLADQGSYGQGTGIEGEPDYLMYYYRYKLE